MELDGELAIGLGKQLYTRTGDLRHPVAVTDAGIIFGDKSWSNEQRRPFIVCELQLTQAGAAIGLVYCDGDACATVWNQLDRTRSRANEPSGNVVIGKTSPAI